MEEEEDVGRMRGRRSGCRARTNNWRKIIRSLNPGRKMKRQESDRKGEGKTGNGCWRRKRM